MAKSDSSVEDEKHAPDSPPVKRRGFFRKSAPIPKDDVVEGEKGDATTTDVPETKTNNPPPISFFQMFRFATFKL